MRYAYPCNIRPDSAGAGFVVGFPDVPEALTGGDTMAETVELASDALATALAGYYHERRDIPEPSEAGANQWIISVPAVVAAKLALYRAMRAQGITNVALAGRLGLTEGAVRKLLNPDHRSHFGQVQIALKALDRVLLIEDKAA